SDATECKKNRQIGAMIGKRAGIFLVIGSFSSWEMDAPLLPCPRPWAPLPFPSRRLPPSPLQSFAYG
ncbi:MAG: hypothetical protein NTV33_00815, partial [Coprothermobacterota bacterium]|nr:hypothetical protein [Coprothermobacterota bacterium]